MTRLSVSTRPPAAADTSCQPAIRATSRRAERPGVAGDERVDRAAGVALAVEADLGARAAPALARAATGRVSAAQGQAARPDGRFGLVVTVTSVPMPYSARSTLACAAFTPVGGADHGDDQADSDGQADRDEHRLAHSAAQLAPKVGEKEHGRQVYADGSCTGGYTRGSRCRAQKRPMCWPVPHNR